MWDVEEQDDKLPPDRFCWHLLDSIKSIDIRIDELKWMLRQLLWEDERRTTLVNKVENLIRMRFLIAYQLMDMIGQHKESTFSKMDLTYKDLKREIRR